MFKFLNNLFGNKKTTDEPIGSAYYDQLKKKKEIKKNKPIKIQNTETSVAKDLNHENIIITETSKENYKELLGFFEKIDKTDGLENKKINLSDSTNFTIEKWKNAFETTKSSTQSDNREILDIIIGFDFGTSSSKIVANFPFNGDIDSYAFPVPIEFRSDNHEHCWKSILYYDKDSDFFDVIPKNENSVQLTEIKTSLMNKTSNKIILKKNNVPFTSEYISIVYLGLLLRLVKGWVFSDIIPKHFKDVSIIQPSWEVNIGLPAAKIDESITGKYKKTLEFAWMISETKEPIKITNFLNTINQSNNELDFLNIRPEVAAQSVGFIQSAMLDYGAYTVVDVGASTLDICIFNYINIDEIEKQALFTANVDLLGAESKNWLEIVNKQFQKEFKKIDLKTSIQDSLSLSLINTKKIRAGTLKEWTSNMPVIICGGGKNSVLHQEALNNSKQIWNSESSGMDGNLKFIDTSIPENLNVNCKKDQYHRLSVAWGLSIEQGEFAKIELPKDIKDLPKYRKIDITDRYIGAEHI
ncbi:hypothetical protein N9W47_03720 [Alphaproteobacteria bacterium]|nr:hypothetical protein [Alphaproteobacteria bacterium]